MFSDSCSQLMFAGPLLYTVLALTISASRYFSVHLPGIIRAPAATWVTISEIVFQRFNTFTFTTLWRQFHNIAFFDAFTRSPAEYRWLTSLLISLVCLWENLECFSRFFVIPLIFVSWKCKLWSTKPPTSWSSILLVYRMESLVGSSKKSTAQRNHYFLVRE